MRSSRSPLTFIAIGLLAALAGGVFGWRAAGHSTSGTGDTVRPADPVFPPAGREDLLAGAQWLAAIEGKEEWRDHLSLSSGYHEFRIRIVFTVRQPPDGFLRLQSNCSLSEWTLNGRPIPQPSEELRSEIIAHVPASMLQAGRNVLEVPLATYLDGPSEGPPAQALGLAAALYRETDEDLAFDLGPILGCAGEDFFTVNCRTSIRAVVTLRVDGRDFADESGVFHSLKATGLKAGTRYEYSLTAALASGKIAVSSGPHPVKTLPGGDKLVFAAMGDNREGAEVWRHISRHVLGSGADFAVHSGDMTDSGQVSKWWSQQFWRPAAEFCASMPCFYVMGNHERSEAVFDMVFATPSGTSNWQQQVGPVLLVGINSYKGDWSEGSANVKWLDGVLSGSKARFIFLIAHHPPYSTVEGGGYKNMRGPFALLARYGGTAMICGHAHGYERSEPGVQTSMIITAGAGAPLYHGTPDDTINPYSKVLESVYNYCLFTIDGDRCTMKALSFGDDQSAKLGEPTVIDTRTWQAREVK
ncbi:MAG: metallophosphoesterase [Phycisphaerae bacterium]